MKNIKQLREKMGALVDEARAILGDAETENRSFTEEELAKHSAKLDEVEQIRNEIKALEKQEDAESFANGATAPVADGQPARQKSEKEIAFEAKLATAKILTTASNKSMSMEKKMEIIEGEQAKLNANGHYRNAVDGFTTLVDTDGGVFLPTTVSDLIMDIANVSGVFRARGLRFPTGGGRIKIPNVMGRLEFSAVNEAGEILVDRFTFKGLELDDLKWALFIPWTNELEGVRGAQLVDVIIRKLGQAFADLADNVVINANGQSAFHNIKGLIARSADAQSPWVSKSSATSTRTTFASIQQKDWNDAQLDLAPGVRDGAFYVSHPDRKVDLLNALFNDSSANPVKWVTMVGETMFVNNVPIHFTDQFPNEDGADKPYAALVNGDYVAIADSGSFATELFSEASIKDKQGATINLASQDMKALRVKTFMDVEFSNITDGGKGAFTVLYTAGS